MRYSLISFDDNQFHEARLTINDMVCIERYIKKNPLTMFYSFPPLGDLAFILYMSLRHVSDFTLDDIYDYIDDNDLSIEQLTDIVIRLLTDMGFLEEPKESDGEESSEKPNQSSSKKKVEDKSFKQIMEEILESYLAIGTPEEFWNSNLYEVTKSFTMHKLQLRTEAENNYVLAMMISTDIGLMLNGKSKKMPKVEEYYPGLYSEEELAKRENDARTKEAVNNLVNFANQFNARKKQKEIEGDEV